MYVAVSQKINISMDQNDIQYIVELLNDGIAMKDWDSIEEVRETLKEFLDTHTSSEDEE